MGRVRSGPWPWPNACHRRERPGQNDDGPTPVQDARWNSRHPRYCRKRGVGTRSLEAEPISPYAKGLFARRVSDGATRATAALEFGVGRTTISVTRRLSDLRIVECTVEGALVAASEAEFQAHVVTASGLSSFGDWILLLRNLVFYFEDRRALVWDPSAQRQILRMLFLPRAVSDDWLIQEREILSSTVTCAT